MALKNDQIAKTTLKKSFSKPLRNQKIRLRIGKGILLITSFIRKKLRILLQYKIIENTNEHIRKISVQKKQY